MDVDLDDLAGRFSATGREFEGSPLYQRFGPVVAADRRLLDIAAQCRPGQQPANMLFASVHFLLLGGARHALAEWYPSVPGDGQPVRPADTAGPAFTDFCLRHRDDLVPLLRHRLVQTNQLKRSAALRYGLVELARLVDGPVTLLEVGCSAGIHLCFDRYSYRYRRPDGSTAAETTGPTGHAAAPVVETEWRDAGGVPDASAGGVPVAVADRIGVDLNPVDVTDPAERRWLEALVWPENRAQAPLLAGALAAVAADPPRTVAGDAVEVLPALDGELPVERPLVVFHSAVQGHVPADRQAAFDAAIDALGRHRPLYRLSLEPPADDQETWWDRFGMAFALDLRARHGERRARRRLAAVHGHGEWIEPLAAPWSRQA